MKRTLPGFGFGFPRAGPGPGAAAALALCLLLAGCGKPAPEERAGDKGGDKGPDAHLVEIVTVATQETRIEHERTGSVRVRRLVRLHNREEGRIESLPYYEGDRVSAGELLVKIDDSLLQAELAKADALARQARVDLERIDGLIKKKAASEDELARARTDLDVALAERRILETRLDHTRITAPFDGVVAERPVEPGDMAAKNTHLLTLIDPGSLVVEAPVSELALPQLQIGDAAEVRIDALGAGVFSGRVTRIYPQLDPYTRQGIVELALDPLPPGVRPGQFARIRLITAVRDRLLAPFSALQRDRDGEFVYRLDADDKAQPTRVRSGVRIADRIEILEGLAPGDRIVSRGFLGLRPGARVRYAAGAANGD